MRYAAHSTLNHQALLTLPQNNMATSHDLEPLMQLKDKTENSTLIMHPTKDVLELLSQDGQVLGSLELFDKSQIQDLRHGGSNTTTAGSEKAGDLGKRGCTSFVCSGDAFCRGIGCSLCSSNPTLFIGVCLPKL